MSSSTPNLHKFLLDENVHRCLHKYLVKNGWNVNLSAKSISDSSLAKISKKENRILVTNDEDFSSYTKNDVFSVILLKIAQGDEELLIKSFDGLLKHFNNFPKRIVVLKSDGWEDFMLKQNFK